MTDNIKKFFEEASKNTALQEKLIKANNDYFQAINCAAKECGIDLTNEDIALLLKANQNNNGIKNELLSTNAEKFHDSEISEDELAAVIIRQSDLDNNFFLIFLINNIYGYFIMNLL